MTCHKSKDLRDVPGLVIFRTNIIDNAGANPVS